MAVLNISGSLTSKLRSLHFLESGDYQVAYVFKNANNVIVRSHVYLLKADGSGVYDETGAQISNVTPPSLLADASSTETHFDTVLANAIAAGKVTL